MLRVSVRVLPSFEDCLSAVAGADTAHASNQGLINCIISFFFLFFLQHLNIFILNQNGLKTLIS